MQRDLDEIIASQNRMLARREEPGDTAGDSRTRKVYADHLEQVARLLERRRCFRTLSVSSRDVVEDPRAPGATHQRVPRPVARPRPDGGDCRSSALSNQALARYCPFRISSRKHAARRLCVLDLFPREHHCVICGKASPALVLPPRRVPADHRARIVCGHRGDHRAPDSENLTARQNFLDARPAVVHGRSSCRPSRTSRCCQPPFR